VAGGTAYVGIDLAWGTRAATGLAVVAEDGSLSGSATVRTDEEVAAWLEGVGRDPVVVALDAPLVVRNDVGMRTCERLVSRAFGAHGAACHASSRARPLFDPPRAETLAERHGWRADPDPARVGAAAGPVAIEVYPHAAMVGLFGLGWVLPYKAKAGRTVDLRRAAMLEVLYHLETVAELRLEEHPRWRDLRAGVEDAARHVDLERVEDEIDAVLCAHLAWLWAHRPSVLRVYGDAGGDGGFIVATPPPAQPPWRARVEPLPLTSP
ncbi:MAG TPA: DUF429 domain-containing protein, partial [Nocardioides sp.]|nr:DUF429 domain-containing protein [Nocardioides sp.]